ncbi:MBL fold metallo-hydrolase [Mesobacterium pallidum]|uniref:MBL fold metallo-hydrolase n=1 Tax=Mesobacterium pallidum TaxID=2872037 RepID=UPI001EE2430C|nr:MBL fold metallo-hydrolase [Mesobacterium pallidum]
MPDVVWFRAPLPMTIGHVNIYLVRDGRGWVMVDAGFGDAEALDFWERMVTGPLADFSIHAILVTHAHIDHVGGAGWLCRRLGAELWMGREEYLIARLDHTDAGQVGREDQQRHLLDMGLDRATARGIADFKVAELAGLTTLPDVYRPLIPNRSLILGQRRFRILSAPGHSPAQIMLHDREGGLLLAADQVMDGVAAPMTILPGEPGLESYDLYLDSLDRLERDISTDTLVLAGHHAPFRGIGAAIGKIRRHHALRAEMVLAAVADRPLTVAQVMDAVIRPGLNPRQCHFAIGEMLAYAHHLVGQGRARWRREDGIRRLSAT